MALLEEVQTFKLKGASIDQAVLIWISKSEPQLQFLGAN